MVEAAHTGDGPVLVAGAALSAALVTTLAATARALARWADPRLEERVEATTQLGLQDGRLVEA